ncbi:DUF6702 family protein [Robertkochia flava]|uniref:DUF6702 family protein n=1 Tax=Robertkochia flava TaxID=3447986 RepID=UPI001CCB9CC5|nr:DUF6702 family protein [Robertkochia marina]
MKKTIALILCCLPLFAAGILHKYYVSVSDITYSEDAGSIQIISRYFTDDLDQLLKARYGIKAGLMTDNELKEADFYIEKYLNDKFRLYINGELKSFRFLGKEYDTDLTKCYLEIPDIKGQQIKSIRIENEVFFELFDDQQNIIHLDFPGKQKSFLLHRGNYKALLNL